jgi:hypothetical protein
MTLDKVIICKCPICGRDARTLDTRKEVDCSLVRCDANETYKCYTDKDNPSLRYVLRNKKKEDIDWMEVERIERGASNLINP